MKHTSGISEHQHPRIGIGSYAYRYNIGFSDFRSPEPMDLFAFLEEAKRLGVDGVQLCENLEYEDMPRQTWGRLRAFAQDNGMFVELGMRDVTPETLSRHIELAKTVGARFIRAVAGAPSAFPEENQQKLIDRVVGAIEGLLPTLEESEIVVGLENHYDLETDSLVAVAEHFASESVGLVFDTTNALGFVEQPEQTLRKMLPFVRSVHVKDYVVEKVEAGYLVRGRSLGEGLLDCPKLLDMVLDQRPDASLIVEMTIRREPSQSPEEVVAWERSMVEQSVRAIERYAARVASR